MAQFINIADRLLNLDLMVAIRPTRNDRGEVVKISFSLPIGGFEMDGPGVASLYAQIEQESGARPVTLEGEVFVVDGKGDRKPLVPSIEKPPPASGAAS